MAKLVKHYGGERIYIPRQVPDPERDETIRQMYVSALRQGSTCMNAYASAAEPYDLSVRRVQQIVAT
jgi:hypothetical protein